MSAIFCLLVIGLAVGGVTSSKKVQCVAVWDPERCSPYCPEIFKPVCDSEGKTHPNECLFKYAACKAAEKGKELTITHEGPCTDYECSECQLLAVARCLWDEKAFVPDCDESDNSFFKTQYNAATDESFCVTRDGALIPESVFKGDTVNCGAFPATLSTDPSMSATPPFGFHPGPKGIYYRAFWDHVTFDRATEMCEEAGGVLSRVFDKESNDQIQRLGGGWIAITDRREEGSWEMVDGRCIPWTNWYPGQPNDLFGSDCARMKTDGRWDDEKCTRKFAFSCQWFSEPYELSLCERLKCEAKAMKDKYEPACEADGTFKDVQCLSNGWCLCLQPNGYPLPNTLYRKDAPDPADCKKLIATKPKCAKLGFERFEGDCNRYFNCAPEQAFHCSCPEGLYFDFEKERCDYKDEVVCPKS